VYRRITCPGPTLIDASRMSRASLATAAQLDDVEGGTKRKPEHGQGWEAAFGGTASATSRLNERSFN
jgi:hypothetical protein